MYEVIFEADNGKRFVFGKSGCTYFGMNIGNGMEIRLGSSQGFLQVGETVENQSVGGRPITVTGELYGDIPVRKNSLRNVCAPFTAGRLVFASQYFIRVYVKAAPTFSASKNNGKFSMQFFAPYPFYSSLEERSVCVGEILPAFRFPVNYSIAHRFGTRKSAGYVRIPNGGDVAVPFRLDLRSDGECPNVTITNIETLAYLKINGTLGAGDTLTIYRDDDGILRAELTTDECVSDAISWIDEHSTLFDLIPGDNLIAITDDHGGANLTVFFRYREAVASLYES